MMINNDRSMYFTRIFDQYSIIIKTLRFGDIDIANEMINKSSLL